MKRQLYTSVYLIILVCCEVNFSRAQGIPPVDMWREHLPYGSAIKVENSGNIIFAATPYSVFSVEAASKDIRRYSRVTGLAETGISTIRYDSATKKLFIAYSNSNLDILSNNTLINISDIKRRNISGDKNIYDVYFSGNNAYLSTGFGIVVVDIQKSEIKDSYFIAPSGGNLKVNSTSIYNGAIYASTTTGLLRCSLNADPRNFINWQIISSLPLQECRYVMNFGNRLLALYGDTILSYNGNISTIFYSSSARITAISKSSNNDNLLVTETSSSNAGKLLVLDQSGNLQQVMQSTGNLQLPLSSIWSEGSYWIADQYSGLVKASNNTYERIIPNSPFELSSGEMIFHKGRLFVAAGAVNTAWNYTYNRFGLYQFADGKWNYYNQFNNLLLDTVLDIITVAADPATDDLYYGSYGGGLLKLNSNGGITIYKQGYLQPAIGDPASYRVAGLAFDQQHNLWISNYGAVNNLVVKKADGSWKSFAIPFQLTENASAQITIDDNNQVWIVSPKGNGLICFNYGNDIDNTADDRWKLFRVGAGNGNLPDNEVYCTVKDKNGLIWIGTANGIALISCTGELFTSNCEATIPLVQQGNFAGILFGNEEVRTIAIDGANRKWVGTGNGLWLISSDGEKIISRFTEDNSPLLSNDINRITIDPQAGEVFISTFKGLSSFRGNATEPSDDNRDVLVFPNPVPPAYSGNIAIRGLVNNARVKITELNGRLVFETTALGGQANWNGMDYRGRKVASGAYLVFVSAHDGKEKMVTKIFIVK